MKDARGIITEPIFYCPEWCIFWIGVDNLMQGIDRSKGLEKMRFEPLSLREIVDYNLFDYISGVLATNIASCKSAKDVREKVIFF